MKFQSSVAGWVAGVRFYKGTGNNGTHTGSLWSASGTLLATGTFTNETRQRLAVHAVHQPGPDQRQHDLRRVLLGSRRPLRQSIRTCSTGH